MTVILAAQIIFIKRRSEKDPLLFRVLPSGEEKQVTHSAGIRYKSDPRSPLEPSSFKIFIYMYLFGCAGSQFRRVGSSSLTRDRTWAPCFGRAVLATGPPGKPRPKPSRRFPAPSHSVTVPDAGAHPSPVPTGLPTACGPGRTGR